MRWHCAWVLGMMGCTPGSGTEPSQARSVSVVGDADVTDDGQLDARGRPRTRRGSDVDRLHGVDVADPYRWLERPDDEGVAGWTAAQHRHARRWLDAVPGRAALRSVLEPSFTAESRSAPVRRGERLFYSRRGRGEDQARHYVSDLDGGHERVLVDPREFSDDGSVTVRNVTPSPRGRYVTYLVSSNAADDATLQIRAVATGRDLDETLVGARYAFPSWTPDEASFYYTGISDDPSVAPPDRPGTASIRRHDIGVDQRFDPVLYGPTGDAQMFLDVELSRDGRWLVLTRQRGFSATDVYVADMRRSSLVFEPVTEGSSARTYVEAVGDVLIAHTNLDAPRHRVMAIDARDPSGPWRELVAEGAGTLKSVHIAGDTMVLHILENAHSRLELRTLKGENPRPLTLPGLGSVGAVVASADQDDAYFSYSSFVDPPQWHRFRPSTAEQTPYWRQRIPIDTERFDVEQVWVTSADGTPVSMFLVKRDDLEPDGRRPTLLTGYGGFGLAMTPAFSATVALWVEHGGVFALPNLRGGGEYGEGWHDAGRGANKQNVFDDFLASAQWLIDEGWTQPARLAIRGGSNGGLLVGAAMTQRPELFGAVVCEVPLLDMVRYHLFGAGPTWIGEYGSADDPDQFQTLFAYSPYHRVVRGAPYPPLLMNSADSDDRVDPNHARKFVAAVQWATPADQPTLLRVEANAGHGGADSVQRRIDAAVDVLSFLRVTVGR